MIESNVTPGYLKRKFPNDPRMHAVIDFINRGIYYLHQEYLNSGANPEGEDKWKRNIVDLDVKMVAALGHGHEMHGNLSTILGNYGNITRAYRETILGSYATDLAGSATIWVPDDRLWEVGNGPDKDHRSFALRQYKNGFMMLANALAIGAFSSGGMLPVDGSIQYINERLQLYFDEVWHNLAFTSDLHPPVTIGEESAAYGSVGADQVFHLNIPTAKKNGFLPGSVLTWLYGLTYALSFSRYYIEDVLYACPSTIFTLDAADLINPRIDVPCVTIYGTVEVVKGPPSENPMKPSIDVATQLELPFILLPANATEPAGVTDEIIFNENTEWTPSTVGVIVDFDNLTAPFAGLKCASVGTIGNNDAIIFTAAAPVNVEDYESLSGFLKLKAIASSKNAIYVQFRLAGVSVTQELSIPWLITDITNWQNIALKLADFTFNSATFDSVRIRWSRVQGAIEHAGFYLDYIKLQKGVAAPGFVDSIELTGDVIGKGKTGTPFETTLKTVNSNVGQYGSATKAVTVTVDAKGRITAISETNIEGSQTAEFSAVGGWLVWRYVGDPDWIQLFQIPIDGDDGQTPELSVQAGWLCWRYVGGSGWTQLYQIPEAGIADAPADGKLYGRKNNAWVEVVIPTDNSVIVRIDFQAMDAFEYTCPVALKFTSQTSESTAATLSVALNTNMAQFEPLTVTPTALGLVILTGEQL